MVSTENRVKRQSLSALLPVETTNIMSYQILSYKANTETFGLYHGL